MSARKKSPKTFPPGTRVAWEFFFDLHIPPPGKSGEAYHPDGSLKPMTGEVMPATNFEVYVTLGRSREQAVALVNRMHAMGMFERYVPVLWDIDSRIGLAPIEELYLEDTQPRGFARRRVNTPRNDEARKTTYKPSAKPRKPRKPTLQPDLGLEGEWKQI
jgi:hypothetical protein